MVWMVGDEEISLWTVAVVSKSFPSSREVRPYVSVYQHTLVLKNGRSANHGNISLNAARHASSPSGGIGRPVSGRLTSASSATSADESRRTRVGFRYPYACRAIFNSLFLGGMINIPVEKLSSVGIFASRACSSSVSRRYASTWPLASARPRKSSKPGVQAPVARMTKSAVMVEPPHHGRLLPICPTMWPHHCLLAGCGKVTHGNG